MQKTGFDLEHTLEKLRHFLPSQTPLKDFIHHNSLHAFQHQKFYEAIFTASKIFGYHVTFNLNEYRKLYGIKRIRPEILNHVIIQRKGEANLKTWRNNALQKSYNHGYGPRIGKLRAKWKKHYHFDLDDRVQPLLFRILASYLDQGIALWHFPFEDQGLLQAIRALEKNGFASFFHSKKAKTLLFDDQCSIGTLLDVVVGDERYYEQYLFDQHFSHRGWSGIVSAIEQNPHSILYPKKIHFEDLVFLDLLLEIDALEQELGSNWQPLARVTALEPANLFEPVMFSEWHEVMMIWQDAFEWNYYDEVLSGVQHLQLEKKEPDEARKRFQGIFCIDERECSLRRHLEHVEPDCETLGCPGFFGVEFFFHPAHGKFYEKLCPVVITPKYLIKEKESGHKRKQELLYNKRSHHVGWGFFISLSLGLWAAVKLMLNIFRPKMSPAISDAFAHMNLEAELIIENTDPAHVENGLQVGFTIEEMANRVENLLHGIGMTEQFAPIVYVVAHGSSSANNPHHGAHDCGACSGRPGSVNARVFAFMANHSKVRQILAIRGVIIPEDTVFISALHDTAADEIAFYDDKQLEDNHAREHELNKQIFEEALNLNAKERSRRFASINTKKDIKKVREAIRKRAVSFFEPRPELGHGTNALCFVGHRQLTKGLFLDRRAFMNSYDYRTDPKGTYLLNVMKPLPPVCGGINLEYYFSRVDNQKMGAGTKLPHHVIGLIGVANSSDGDLRPGLPLQMIEVHDPIRLMIIVEHFPEVVLKTITAEDSLYGWFINEWVHLMVIHPIDKTFYYFREGAFQPYKPQPGRIAETDDIHELIENTKEMETNHILDATRENLPIHLIKS